MQTMTMIAPVTLQVALKTGKCVERLSSPRTWTPPRITVKLPASPLALLDIKYFVADAELADENVLKGVPVPHLLFVEHSTFLEGPLHLCNGPDCSALASTSVGGERDTSVD